MAASLQYPCHPAMGRKKRYTCPVRFGAGKTRHSKCKQCRNIWSIKLSSNGPIFTLKGHAY
jgi:hypothetical protein